MPFGNLSGGGGLTKLGAGMLTLSGSSTFSGDLTVDGGTLNMPGGYLSSPTQYVGNTGSSSFTQSGGTNLPVYMLLGWNPGSSATYALNGGSLSATIIQLSTDGAGIFMQSGGTNTVSSQLILGDGGVNTPGAIDTLSGSNTYIGGTLVTAGTLILTNVNVTEDGTNLTVGNFGAFAPVMPDLAANSLAGSPVPEPSTLGLLTAAVCSAAVYRRLRPRQKKQ